MWKNKLPFRLALNRAASDEIVWHCKRGVIEFYESGAALAQDKMEETVGAQYQDSLKTTKDLDGGPFPAYTSEKSWDEASGKTVFYHNVISGADFAAQHFYVASSRKSFTTAWVILEIDENSGCWAQIGAPFFFHQHFEN